MVQKKDMEREYTYNKTVTFTQAIFYLKTNYF